MLSYRLKNITFHLKDLYDEGSASDRNPQISRNYFHFGADSPHRIEAGIEWQVSRKVPITLSWYTILFGARDVDTRGRRCYSSYVEVAYPFTVKTIDLENGRRSRALENGRRRRSQRFCREKRLHKRRKTVGGQKHGFLPNRTLHPSLLVSAQRGHELRREAFRCGCNRKKQQRSPSVIDGRASLFRTITPPDIPFADKTGKRTSLLHHKHPIHRKNRLYRSIN